jgi:HAD superfamily hydrolase (TIGR01509 family)
VTAEAATPPFPDIRGVVFDLDGVLIDSEHLWDCARRAIVCANGGRWPPTASADIIGMSAPEWSGYLQEVAGISLSRREITETVAEEVIRHLTSGAQVIQGADEALKRVGRRWPLGLATSASRSVVDAVLREAGWSTTFAVAICSEEVARGKPAPDVYLAVAAGLGLQPGQAVAVEDSDAGIRSASAAGLACIAIPNPDFPPSMRTLRMASAVLSDISSLDAQVIEGLCPLPNR